MSRNVRSEVGHLLNTGISVCLCDYVHHQNKKRIIIGLWIYGKPITILAIVRYPRMTRYMIWTGIVPIKLSVQLLNFCF